jgi:hypothetical protein
MALNELHERVAALEAGPGSDAYALGPEAERALNEVLQSGLRSFRTKDGRMTIYSPETGWAQALDITSDDAANADAIRKTGPHV